MKRTLSALLLLGLLALALMLTGCAMGSDGAGEDKDSALLLGAELAATSSNAAYLNTEVSTELIFTFRIPASAYEDFMRDVYEPQWTAYVGKTSSSSLITEENGIFAAVTELGARTLNGVRYYCFDVSCGSVFAEDYFSMYGAVLTVSYKIGGEERTVSFNATPRAVYDVAFSEYTDRSDAYSEEYPYAQADGTYSPWPSLGTHRSILATALSVYVSDDGIRYVYNSEFYTAPYVCEYFDGVLCVRTASGDDINGSILKHLIVNGKEEYFEIHDGIIRIVV